MQKDRILIQAILALVCLFSSLHAGATDRSAAKGYLLDLSDASVHFSIRVLGVFMVEGTFEQVQGGLLFSDNCAAERIAFSIDTRSVTTRNAARDAVVRGPAMLNSGEHPSIYFTSTRIISGESGPQEIIGKLYLNGIRREVTFVITRNDNPRSDLPAGDYLATTNISREDFDVHAPIIGVADTIRIAVGIHIRRDSAFLTATRSEEIMP